MHKILLTFDDCPWNSIPWITLADTSACCTLYGPCWSSPPPCPRRCRWCSAEVMLLDITKFLDPGLLYVLIGNLMAISWPKTQLCQNITSRNNIFNKKNILKCEFIIPPGKSNLFAPFLFIFKFSIQNWLLDLSLF